MENSTPLILCCPPPILFCSHPQEPSILPHTWRNQGMTVMASTTAECVGSAGVSSPIVREATENAQRFRHRETQPRQWKGHQRLTCEEQRHAGPGQAQALLL
jgi:hypothetical protein